MLIVQREHLKQKNNYNASSAVVYREKYLQTLFQLVDFQLDRPFYFFYLSMNQSITIRS